MRHQCQIVESLISNVRISINSLRSNFNFYFHFQYGFFFENDPLPKLKNKSFQASNDSGSELPSADFLLENVAKIERKIQLDGTTLAKSFKAFFAAMSRDSHKDGSSRFVANIVQAANRKIRKTAQRRSTSSSLTPDTLSLDSMTTVSESLTTRVTIFALVPYAG